MDHRLTTTALTIPGYRVTHTLGVVRGVTVRARWIGRQITASSELSEEDRSRTY